MTGLPAVSARVVGTALAATVLLAGAGCSSTPDRRGRPPCPHVSVLSDAAALTRFAEGAGQDLVDVDYQIDIIDVRSGCQYVNSESDEQVVIVAMAPVFVALRGPENRDRQARFEYFVSVVNSQRVVLNKQTFGLLVEFPGNLTRVALRDDDPPVTADITVAEGRAVTDYEILIGLQLTPDQLEYNRRRGNNQR